MTRQCETCKIEFCEVDWKCGKEYYSCERCRKYDRKSNGYKPLLFLSHLKSEMRDSKLVNKIWDKIYDLVLGETGGQNIYELKCFHEKDFDKMLNYQEKNYDHNKELDISSINNIKVDDSRYYWFVTYKND